MRETHVAALMMMSWGFGLVAGVCLAVLIVRPKGKR